MEDIQNTGHIYLIPNTLGYQEVEAILPVSIKRAIEKVDFFLVENIRTARRYISKWRIGKPISELHFEVLDKNTEKDELERFIRSIKNGSNAGIISEAGCPGIADPGAAIVKHAHKLDIQVIPLVGPSSVFLALMASGLNGQNFAFVGYLPIKKHETKSAIKALEKKSKIENQTQIFIETPYRNMQLLDALIAVCKPNTMLCIATSITLPDQSIKTRRIRQWKNSKPQIHKLPTVFLLHSY